MSNPVVQWQIITKAPDRAAGFYGELFGWKIAPADAFGAREVKAEEGGIAGGLWPAPPAGADFVQLFVSVEDLEATVAVAVRLGGRVVFPPTVLPEGDAMAVLHDPLGIPFGVMRRKGQSR